MLVIHPIAASDPGSAYKAILSHSWSGPEYWLARSIALGGSLIRWPFNAALKKRLAPQLDAVTFDEGPYFIIGHWRSGTTHLHNLLSQDDQFGYCPLLATALPWDILDKSTILKNLIERNLPEERPMDMVAVGINSPQEEEMALGNMGQPCYYYSYYFVDKWREHYERSVLMKDLTEKEIADFGAAHDYFYRKLTVLFEGKPLMLKNPPSTCRALFLKKLYPNAKFIHIIRKPEDCLLSMTRHWSKILPYFALQRWEHCDFEAMSYEIYGSFMEKWLEVRQQLPKEDLIEVTFEDVERDPIGECAKVYDKFNLKEKEAGLAKIKAYADTQKDYQKNKPAKKMPEPPAVAERIREIYSYKSEDLVEA